MSSYNINAITPGVLVNPTAKSAFPTITGGSTRAVLSDRNYGSMHGRLFRVRAAFKVTGGTTTNFTPSIMLNSGANTNLTTFTSDTDLTALSARAFNSVTRMWSITLELIWDGTTQALYGRKIWLQDTVFATPVVISGSGPTVSAATGFDFICTGFFSVSNAANTAVVTEFTMDQD